MTKFNASVSVKLHGGPLDGKTAVSYGAQVGSLIDVNHHSYRVTSVENVPRWNELVGSATFIEKKAAAAKPRLPTPPRLPTT
jgi:hypothetical protein